MKIRIDTALCAFGLFSFGLLDAHAAENKLYDSFAARVLVFGSKEGQGVQKKVLGKLIDSQNGYQDFISKLELPAQKYIENKISCVSKALASNQNKDITKSPLFHALSSLIECKMNVALEGISNLALEADDYKEIINLSNKELKNSFGKLFLSSFDIIDLNDIAVMMASGHSKPWTRYDESKMKPLLDKWSRATAANMKSSSVVDIYRILSEKPNGNYRDENVIAGGDTKVNGIGYYRVTLRQKAALEVNPYLLLEFVADPYRTDGQTVLGRHRYPDASIYKKFQNRLSPKLVADLAQADQNGQLKNESDPKFKELTSKVLQELIDDALKMPESPAKIYQRLISIHPFTDFNGRSLRAWYKNQVGYPLFVRNFDIDLFTTPAEFQAEVRVGLLQYLRIKAGLIREDKNNPGYPDFYKVPEIWKAVSGLEDVSLDQLKVSKMIDTFKSPKVQNDVRQKLDLEVTQALRSVL